MYHLKRKFVCPKCQHETMYGPHDPFGAPVLSEGPVCPKCYADFLRQHCGVMVDAKPLAPETCEKLPGAAVLSGFI